jgi:hypothetical protein
MFQNWIQPEKPFKVKLEFIISGDIIALIISKNCGDVICQKK